MPTAHPVVLASLASIAVACSPPAAPPSEPAASATADASGDASARPPKPPAPDTLTLWVGPTMVDCEGGAGPMKCLRVRRAADGEWELFYQGIEGFTHEEGFEAELRVTREEVDRPPADGSKVRYRLVSIEKKTKAP